MSAILHIHEGQRALDPPVIEALATRGVVVRESIPEGIPAVLSTRDDPGFDAAVISPSVESPLQIARTFHQAEPNAHIIFMTDEEHETALRRSLMLAPRIGNHWSVLKPESAVVAIDAIRTAVDGAARRRQLRTTINRLNVQISGQNYVAARREPIVSDHFIATVFDQLTDAVVMLDNDGSVITANTAASRALGRDIPRGTRAEDLFGTLPEEPAELTDLQVTIPGGRTVVLEVRTQAVHDERQRRLGTAVVARDVTQRHYADARRQLLTRSTEHLSQTVDMRAALDQLADVLAGSLGDLCVIDILEGDRLTRYSAAAGRQEDQETASQLKGFQPVGDASHPALEALRGESAFVCNDASGELWDSFAVDPVHRELVDDLGLHSFVAAAVNSGERRLGVLTVARGRRSPRFSAEDVDLVVEVARRTGMALHNAWLYHEAQQANRAKDAFLATLSHELRTPMTSILGWLQILRLGGTDDAAIQEGLAVMEKSARAQAQLIDDLLDLSRIDSGKLHMEPREVRVRDVVASAIDTIRPAANARQIDIHTRLDPDAYVMGDPNRLQQAVWNLLSNAVKFSSRGSFISVAIERTQSVARIIVADTGRGISPEFLPFVFDRFRQADSATTRSFGGLGLGLSLVRQIIELHGGTVSAASEGEGQGAAFTVELPFLALRDRTGADDLDAVSLPELQGARILVVEDDRASGGMISSLLQRVSVEVELARSVPEALVRLQKSVPDLLISDVAMPDQDGYDLIREVRYGLGFTAEMLPAIALTAFGGPATEAALLTAGFQRHMQKPADVYQLLRAVAELLDRKTGTPADELTDSPE